MARRRPNLELSVEFINPEMALEMLEKNVHNRKLSKRLVAIYAEAIIGDEWVLNGEPIIFDKKGNLQSGQHRLHAIVEAAQGIWTVVVRGAEPENLYSLDAGRRRKVGDALTLRGEKDVANLGTALSWWWRYQNGVMDRRGDTATNTHLLKMLDETPEIRDAMVYGRKVKNLGYSVGLMAALFMAFKEKDEEDAIGFFDRLEKGTGLENGDPIHTLRRWMERTKLAPRRPTQTHIAAVTIKCWNGFREHRTMQVVTFKGTETFPEVT